MKCPVDGTTLVIAERQGVEIDYCPLCRGVWLDRGELDKIIERAVAELAAQSAQPARQAMPRQQPQYQERQYQQPQYHQPQNQQPRGRYRDDDDDDDYRRRGNRGKRIGSFLEDLFDFD